MTGVGAEEETEILIAVLAPARIGKLKKLKRSPYLRQFIAHLMEADCFFAKVFMDDGLHLFPHKHSLTIKKTESVRVKSSHKKNYNPSSGHQPQQTTYKVKKAKEDEPRRSRNII